MLPSFLKKIFSDINNLSKIILNVEHQDGTFDSALTERKGIEAPEPVNPYLQIKQKKAMLSVDAFMDGILSGNRTILSQAITLIESSLPKHREIAQEIIERCLPHAGKSIRLGITGVPGAGKSTFIEALGTMLTNEGNKLAVLAIDPSSERTKGSILGDKTRMEELSVAPNAFIRPSPSAGSLGGVARKTRESIILCEAAGFNTIFVETVGVGQSETAAHGMVDFFLLIQIANAGDELQGIKRGIMEMADMITINKADGDNIQKANVAKVQFQNALMLFPPTESGWIPTVTTCSAHTKNGVKEIWDTVLQYVEMTKNNGYFHAKRVQQDQRILSETIDEHLKMHFYNNSLVKEKLKEAILQIKNATVNPYMVAQKILDEYFENN